MAILEHHDWNLQVIKCSNDVYFISSVYSSAVMIIVVMNLSRLFRSIIPYHYRDFSSVWRHAGQYICMAHSQCKYDRFTTSLLKFQHA